jgi:hypothetical protein
VRKQTVPTQKALPLPFRGGRRRGAGRKPAGAKAGASHAPREKISPNVPVLVTLRMADHVWNLRSERSFRVIDRAVRGVQRSGSFRIIHFTVQGNHLHAHVLRTPAEVRNAVRYVLGNFESHAVRRGALASPSGWVDPFSSASGKAPREAQASLFREPATSEPQGWLLRQGVRRAG